MPLSISYCYLKYSYQPINAIVIVCIFRSICYCYCYCFSADHFVDVIVIVYINRSMRWCCCQLPCLLGTSPLLLCCVLSLHCPHDHTLSCLCNYNCHEDIHYYLLYNTIGIIYMVLRLSRPLNCARIVFRAFTCKWMCSICCYPNLLYMAPQESLAKGKWSHVAH